MFLFTGYFMLTAFSCHAQIPGCTDPLANNYDPGATVNDGSCMYDPASVYPQDTFLLGDQVKESSGLILWNGNLWTHNDNSDTVLYGMDTTTADIERTHPLKGVENVDWEEISQDQEHIYIGDFGNNTSGNRTDLHILRIKKNSLLTGNHDIDTIWFSYSDQTDFSPAEANQTDFDCEAMIVTGDSIYLFTKQWISAQTCLYRLPKTPGSHHALYMDTYDIQGLITGATCLGSESLVVLCGYTGMMQPFLYLLYDFRDQDFFSGNKRRITMSLPFHQIEGIATRDGLKYYISNESLVIEPFANITQKLHIFDLSPFLTEYLSVVSSNKTTDRLNNTVMIYPNPVSSEIIVRIDRELQPVIYEIYDQSARMVSTGILTGEVSTVDISHLTPGLFTFIAGDQNQEIYRILKYQ